MERDRSAVLNAAGVSPRQASPLHADIRSEFYIKTQGGVHGKNGRDHDVADASSLIFFHNKDTAQGTKD